MAKTYTTQEIATMLGVTPQTVNRYVRNACKSLGVKVSEFGTASSDDRRIRTFSEQELEHVLIHVPKERLERSEHSEQCEAIAVTPTTTRQGLGFLSFTPQDVVIEAEIVEAGELVQETSELQTITRSGFQVLSDVFKDRLRQKVELLDAQLDHAIAGMGAVAVTEAAKTLDKRGKR